MQYPAVLPDPRTVICVLFPVFIAFGCTTPLVLRAFGGFRFSGIPVSSQLNNRVGFETRLFS